MWIMNAAMIMRDWRRREVAAVFIALFDNDSTSFS
jgi:hypothetical protein